MLNNLQQFISMNGYGVYVWSAYISVIATLAWQWFRPWQRFRRYKKSIASDA